MDDELAFHLAEKIGALQRDGLSPDEARIEALRQFGDLTTARSRLVTEGWRGERYAKWRRILDDLAHDSKHAWRSLWRTPGFTLAAVLVLGLGIGANTAIFSVINAVLFRPIPFLDPDTLVFVPDGGGSHAHECHGLRSSRLAVTWVLRRTIRRIGRTGMPTTRRRILATAALGAGASAVDALLPLAAVAQTRAASVEERIRADLEQHAAFGDKFSGGPGDSANADWIAGRLRNAGYRVDVPEFDAPFFVRRKASLGTGSVAVDVDPQAPVVPTDPRGITARLALVDDAADDRVGDVRGRIALIVAPFARHAALFPTRGIGRTVTAAADAGAAAIVIVTTGPSGEAVALNAPEEPFVPVPTAVLAPKSAAAFVDAARSSAKATLILDGDATHRPCRNVVARIERGRRWIAMSTPRSGWYGCTAERGTGTAAFLEIADWAVERFADLSIFLMNTGGHEYFFAGSQRVVHEAPPPEDTLVWTHIGATLAARDAVERDGEWVMLDTPDPQRSLMASTAARDAAAAAFEGLSGLEEPGIIRSQAGELSTFTDMGYRNAFAVIGLHRWFHTRLDTLATVDAGLVVPVLRAHQKTIERLVAAA